MLVSTIVLLVSVTTPVTAELACPAELSATAVAVVHAPEGWTGFVPTKLLLHDVGFSTGRLEDRATLIGEHRKQRNSGVFTVTYGALRGWEGRDRWLMCKYGEGNDIVVAKRLANVVDQCIVTYTPERSGANVIQIACK